jgi:hypothetical protein
MRALIDFSSCAPSGRYYAGSERKVGVVLADGSPVMLKFRKATAFGPKFNHVSEYLGSRIFALAGLPAQEVELGTYRGEDVVACRDFNTSEDVQFVPFNEVGESTLEEDKDAYQYDYADIMRMLRDNSKLPDPDGTIEAFWRIYVVDALIGNFDRHGGNWGFLKRDGRYSLAPVFDNGSCLFPNLASDEAVAEVLASPGEMLRRVHGFPTSQIRLDGKKSSYDKVIGSLQFRECNDALTYVVETLPMDAVADLVNETPGISDIRRTFYQRILAMRYELIVLSAYEKLRGCHQ